MTIQEFYKSKEWQEARQIALTGGNIISLCKRCHSKEHSDAE